MQKALHAVHNGSEGDHLGLASYYLRFIYHFVESAASLCHLLENNPTSNGHAEMYQDAFSSLKRKYSSSSVLAFPRPKDTFIFDTDASDSRMGAVLTQKYDGQGLVIAYGSHTLTKAEWY